MYIRFLLIDSATVFILQKQNIDFHHIPFPLIQFIFVFIVDYLKTSTMKFTRLGRYYIDVPTKP